MKHIFVTVPTNSGSTVFNSCLARCRNAVGLGSEGDNLASAAGANIPVRLESRRLWTQEEDVLNNPFNYEWDKIADCWKERWKINTENDADKTNPTVFVEKSPPNVVRAIMMEQIFENSHFIISMRDPYAFAISVASNVRQDQSWHDIAKHWVRCAELQTRNKHALKNNVAFSYESVFDNHEEIQERIISMIPELDDLDLEEVHGGINQKRFDSLTPRIVNHLNHILKNHEGVLDEWGYSLR